MSHISNNLEIIKLACSAVSVVSSVSTLNCGGKNSIVFHAILVRKIPFNDKFSGLTDAGYPAVFQSITRPLLAANIFAIRLIIL
jgi:hypothetical protein